MSREISNKTLLSELTVGDLKRIILGVIREKSGSDKHNTSKEFLNVFETSELICMPVETVYKYVSKSLIPCIRNGRRIKFSRTDVVAWMNARRQKTREEILQENQQNRWKKK
jgi:excisionase family DNA binding protein